MNPMPVHQSLITPITIMGVARNIFWANALLTLDLVFLGAWWLLGISVVLHLAAKKICSKDPEFFELLAKYYFEQEDYLEG